jgi:hypothetical protein
MTSFVIYNPETGAIKGSYTVKNASDPAAAMTANTPARASALAVDASHPVMCNQSGWQVQAGALVAVTPTDAQLLAQAQAKQLAVLGASYNAAKTANVAYMETSFMADDESQQIFAHALTAYTAVGSTPDGFYVVDASYNKVPMTLAQLQGLISAIAAQVWAAFQRWVEVKEAVAAATTVAAVQAITW